MRECCRVYTHKELSIYFLFFLVITITADFLLLYSWGVSIPLLVFQYILVGS